MKWDKFIKEYNDLTEYLYNYWLFKGKENKKLNLFLFQHPLKINYIKYYYSYEIAQNQINFQISVKQSGKSVDCFNLFFNEKNNIRYALRENDFFNRQSLSNINVHKTIFLWTYFLMLSKVAEYEIGECL
jgi:hypothetical protein